MKRWMIDDSTIVEQHHVFLLPLAIDTVRSFLVEKSLEEEFVNNEELDRRLSDLFDRNGSSMAQPVGFVLLVIFLSRLDERTIFQLSFEKDLPTHREDIRFSLRFLSFLRRR